MNTQPSKTPARLNSAEIRKQDIMHALAAFVAQRPGLEYANYGDPKSYRAEMRSITRDRHDYDILAAAVACFSITADDLIKASRGAYSGRLTIKEEGDRRVTVSYCTGQYFPTEYRKAACAVLVQALWNYARECMPDPTLHHNTETGETVNLFDGLLAGDWLRRYFRWEFGARLQRRWFN